MSLDHDQREPIARPLAPSEQRTSCRGVNLPRRCVRALTRQECRISMSRLIRWRAQRGNDNTQARKQGPGAACGTVYTCSQRRVFLTFETAERYKF